VPRIYMYKMTTDNGGAPCAHDGKLSLAICKPMIRMSALQGDTVIGFAGNELYADNCLIYAAEVVPVPGEQYYSDENQHRPDCIYMREAGRYHRRPSALFHPAPGNLAHDLGAWPQYERAWVLLSKSLAGFRYWGGSCPIRYQERWPELASFVRSMTQGHRVNLPPMLQKDVESLLREVWQTKPTPANSSIPSRPVCGECLDDDDFAVCDC
jgi:hypothetical protein